MSDPAEHWVVVAGASGYAGALAAELVWRHPRLELAAATSRSRRRRAPLDRSTRATAAAVELTELDLDALEDVDAAIVAYPHGAAAPVVAEMRGLGISVVDLSADFRLVDASDLRALVRAARRARAARERGLRAHRARPRPDPRPPSWSPTPAAIRPPALLALAPLAERGVIGSVVIDAKSGVSGAGRDGGERLAHVNVTENVIAYGADGHRHLPEIEQELRKLTPGTSSASRPGAPGRRKSR